MSIFLRSSNQLDVFARKEVISKSSFLKLISESKVGRRIRPSGV